MFTGRDGEPVRCDIFHAGILSVYDKFNDVTAGGKFKYFTVSKISFAEMDFCTAGVESLPLLFPAAFKR